MASQCDVKNSSEKLTIYAKFLSGDILPIEVKPTDTVDCICSNIFRNIDNIHRSLIQIILDDESKFHTGGTKVNKILKDGDMFNVFVNSPIIELVNTNEKLHFDGYPGTFTKYSLRLSTKPSISGILHINLTQFYKIDFWYNHKMGYFCQSYETETDKNRRTREYETRFYPSGMWAENWQKYFEQAIPERYCQFVLDNFDYDKFVSESIQSL
jgi:hypothetical protein